MRRALALDGRVVAAVELVALVVVLLQDHVLRAERLGLGVLLPARLEDVPVLDQQVLALPKLDKNELVGVLDAAGDVEARP